MAKMKTTDKISLNVPLWWRRAVDKAAAAKGLDRTNYIRMIVTERLEDDGFLQAKEESKSHIDKEK